ncbi:MAG: hypothetical protein ISR90_01155 [Candidatus Marinimicrobia bacterium]|nr:hypothetical protein [Candidatus Neomarinimicrobiota bacterium]MBL7109924.1 hypothetical protein [Candidatus Neomarinimicrobiota bacterium]
MIYESVRGLFRAKIPALISSATITITLVIFSISYFSYINLVGFSYDFKKQYQIDVFFDTDLDRSESLNVFNSILLIDGIEQGSFVDKDDASRIFESYFTEDVEQIIGYNPLPMGGKFELSIEQRNPNGLRTIVNEIRLIPKVEQATYQSGMIARVDKIIENVLGSSVIAGIIIFLVSVILVSNTIRLIIHSKEDNIATLHLLGASNIFIKIPFLLEGVYQGLIGAGFSIGILWLLKALLDYIVTPFVPIDLINPNFIISGNLCIGTFLGLVGSYRGISKYLK